MFSVAGKRFVIFCQQMFQLSTWIEKICWVMRCIRKMQPEVKVIESFYSFSSGQKSVLPWKVTRTKKRDNFLSWHCFPPRLNNRWLKITSVPWSAMHLLSLLFGWKTPRLVRVARCSIGMMQSHLAIQGLFQVREGCTWEEATGILPKEVLCSLRFSGLGFQVNRVPRAPFCCFLGVYHP